MSRSYSLLSLVLSGLALGACVIDDGDAADAEASVDQEVSAPRFRLKSTLFANQVVAPINSQAGQLVTLAPQGGFAKEFWRFENQQLINDANQSLCLQASSTSPGATLTLAACVDPFDITINPPQFWKLRLRPNGTSRWENLVSHLYLDASSHTGLVETQPLSGGPSQDFKRQF